MYEYSASTVEELNDKKGKCVYVLVADDQMISFTSKSDMDKHLSTTESIVSLYDAKDLIDATLLFGIVLDIKELPYEISKEIMEGRKIWVLCDATLDVSYESFETMEEATKFIASQLKVMDEDRAEITNFAVLVAEELGLSLRVEGSGKHMIARDVYED